MNRESLSLSNSIIGVDVGGTKIAVGLIDPFGRVIASMFGDTDISSVQATLDSIANIVFDFVESKGLDLNSIEAIGFGIPGLVDPEKGIGIASVNLNWENVPVREELMTRLNIPCVIDNDVRTGAIGEGIYGEAKKAQNYIYLNVGTGVSAVIIINRKIFKGENGLAGEIGHAVIDPLGPVCKCGGKGCLEAMVSGPAIAKKAAEHYSRITLESALDEDSSDLSFIPTERVFMDAANDHQYAIETVREIGDLLSYALQYLSLAYDSEIIILGGGIFQGGKVLTDYIKRKLSNLAHESWVFNSLYRPDLVRISALGVNAGILGAAALVAFSDQVKGG